jgi:hypothetical protein
MWNVGTSRTGRLSTCSDQGRLSPHGYYAIYSYRSHIPKPPQYSQVKVQHRCLRHRWQNCRRHQRHRWQICHRYQRHRRQSLTTVSLVLLILVANCHRYQRHQWLICHCCQQHRWQTMGTISGCRYLKVNLKAKFFIYVNCTIQRCPNKIIKIFLIKDSKRP